MKTGELIIQLLERNGIDTSDALFKDIAGISLTVPTPAEEAIVSMMTSKEALDFAKNNPDVKKHYFAQAFNGIDKNIIMSAQQAGLSEEKIQELEAEKSTGKRQELFTKFMKEELDSAKTGSKTAKTDEVEAKYKGEIDRLNNILNQSKTDFEGKLKEKDSEFYNYKLESKKESFLASQKWSENYPADMRGTLGKLAIEKKLKELGAKEVLDENGEIKFVRSDNPDLEYFDASNKKLTFTELATRTLAENKFLAVSSPTPTTVTSQVPAAAMPKTPTVPKSTFNALSESMKDQGIA